MNENELKSLFSRCFKDKDDSYLVQYISLIRKGIHNRNLFKTQRDFTHNGYEKLHIIPRKFFQINNLKYDRFDKDNTIYLNYKDYLKANVILMNYFSRKDETLTRFFKERLYGILFEMENENNVPMSSRKRIYFKTINTLQLTEEDYSDFSELMKDHYKGRRNKRKPQKLQKSQYCTE